jgi:hypothetical protein
MTLGISLPALSALRLKQKQHNAAAAHTGRLWRTWFLAKRGQRRLNEHIAAERHLRTARKINPMSE